MWFMRVNETTNNGVVIGAFLSQLQVQKTRRKKRAREREKLLYLPDKRLRENMEEQDAEVSVPEKNDPRATASGASVLEEVGAQNSNNV